MFFPSPPSCSYFTGDTPAISSSPPPPLPRLGHHHPLLFLTARLCPCFPEAPWILHTVDILIHDALYSCSSSSDALWPDVVACFAASADGGKIWHLIINWITGGIFGARWSWEPGNRELFWVFALKSLHNKCKRSLPSSAWIRCGLMFHADVISQLLWAGQETSVRGLKSSSYSSSGNTMHTGKTPSNLRTSNGGSSSCLT